MLLALAILIPPFLSACQLVPQTNTNPTTTTPTTPTYAKLMGPELIDAGAPSPASVLVQSGLIGQAFYLQLPAFGGQPPYHWELVSGSIPFGLTLDPAGKISGNLTKTGNYQCSLILSDAAGTEVAQNVRITAAQILPMPTNQGEMGPRDVGIGVTPTAPIVIYTPPPPKPMQAMVSVVIPVTFSTGEYLALMPCVQGAGSSWTFRLVGLLKGFTYDTNSGLVQGDTSGLTEPTTVSVFMHGANGLDAQTSFTIGSAPRPTYSTTTTTQHGGTTAYPTVQPTVNQNNQYIQVIVSQSTYGVADIWVDGAGPYRQQYKAAASVGTHTIRIKTYGGSSYPAMDKTVTGSVSAGKYWIYQLK